MTRGWITWSTPVVNFMKKKNAANYFALVPRINTTRHCDQDCDHMEIGVFIQFLPIILAINSKPGLYTREGPLCHWN